MLLFGKEHLISNDIKKRTVLTRSVKKSVKMRRCVTSGRKYVHPRTKCVLKI